MSLKTWLLNLLPTPPHAQQQIYDLESQLWAIDLALARRPALDAYSTRWHKIERLCKAAARGEAADRQRSRV